MSRGLELPAIGACFGTACRFLQTAARAIQASARLVSGLFGDDLAVLPHVDRRTVHTRGPASRHASAAQRSTHLRRERLRSWFLRSLHGPFSTNVGRSRGALQGLPIITHPKPATTASTACRAPLDRTDRRTCPADAASAVLSSVMPCPVLSVRAAAGNRLVSEGYPVTRSSKPRNTDYPQREVVRHGSHHRRARRRRTTSTVTATARRAKVAMKQTTRAS